MISATLKARASFTILEARFGVREGSCFVGRNKVVTC